MSAEGPNTPKGIDPPPVHENYGDLDSTDPAILSEPNHVAETPAETAFSDAFMKAYGNPGGESTPSGVEKGPGADLLDATGGGISPETPIPQAFKFTPANESLFKGLTGKAKNLFSKIHENADKIPGANFVNKMRAAHNDAWAQRSQEKSTAIKSEIAAMDARAAAINSTKPNLEAQLVQMQLDGTPGATELQAEIAKLEVEQNNLALLKASHEVAAEKQDIKSQIYTEKRDAIADKVNEKFNEKLRPIEEAKSQIEEEREKLSHDEVAMGVRHKRTMRKLDKNEEARDFITEQLKVLKLDKQAINEHPTIKAIDEERRKTIAELQSEKMKMTEMKGQILQKLLGTEQKIAKLEGKKIQFSEAAVAAPAVSATETVSGAPSANEAIAPPSLDVGFIETNEHKKIETFINTWNTFVDDEDSGIPEDRKIDIAEFTNASGMMKEDDVLFDEFKDLIISHLQRHKKVSFDETELRGTLERFKEKELDT